MRWRTDSDECASPSPADWIAEVKKYLSSKMPRGVAMYLFEVTRETVDSCIEMASATVAQVERPQMLDAVGEEAVLLADDLFRDLQDGARALIEAFDEPVGGLQALEKVVLVLRSCASCC